MITETTRDNALIAAANGKPAFVITKKAGYPDIVNLTKLLSEALTEKDNIFVADVEPLKAEKDPYDVHNLVKVKDDLVKVKDKAEFVKANNGGRKPSVDDGKIMALYKAGWSVAKIADEFGVVKQTITNHLNALKEDGEL